MEVTDEDEAQRWRRRAADATALVSQTRAALRATVEGRYYNPRRFLPHNRRHKTFDGYREVIDALERVAHQTASLTRTLYQWPQDETGTDRDGFLRDYADLLEALADITDRFSAIDEEHLTDQAEELCEAAKTAQDKRARLVERTEDTSLPLGDPSRPYGILLAEATRLTEEAQHSCDSLRHATASSSTASGGGSDS
ncbi:hypothetical protein DTL70_11345 [Streptomyces diacarni]|uniref:Uncharacterized protein n=1 Tax=Streptomyces diacarni TaxID=2800381 RepID=A0A367F3R0_9ACTN|nr:hypothetical protein DTL70_11345 [Streptomyces diacarni]